MCTSVAMLHHTRDPCLNLQTLDSIGQSVFGYDFKALDSKTKTAAQQAFMALTNRRSIRFVSLTNRRSIRFVSLTNRCSIRFVSLTNRRR